MRITGQLVDALTGAHLWADRFDGALEEVFELQDQVTASVVGAMALKLEQAEINRSKRKPTESLDAYDYYLRGMASHYLATRAGCDDALRFFYKAIDLDPDFAAAHGWAAVCYNARKQSGWIAVGVATGLRSAISGLTHRSKPSSYSITPSARSRSDVDTSMPSALAVLRLTIVSNLVARSTGKSFGFAPFRILSTKVAARRNMSVKLIP